MLRLEMLPAGHGDCLWIEYGDPLAPARVLIDGGAKGTYRRALRPKLLSLPREQRRANHCRRRTIPAGSVIRRSVCERGGNYAESINLPKAAVLLPKKEAVS